MSFATGDAGGDGLDQVDKERKEWPGEGLGWWERD